MSFCRKEGKDVIIFATEEDHKVPSTVALAEPEPQPGLILADGSINWNCPCLGGMATGPCGVEFREAFSCFHYSKSDPKGSECFDNFRKMQVCMAKYPTLYNNPDDEDDVMLTPDFAEGTGKEPMLPSADISSNTSGITSSAINNDSSSNDISKNSGK